MAITIRDTKMTINDFKPGDKVRYIPNHAHGKINHPDCEDGIVSSINEVNVFVRYYDYSGLKTTAQATDPDNLVIRGNL
jgi:hypothetical protein